jgi:hypothetical protein
MKAIAAVALLCSYTCQQSDCISGPPLCSSLSLNTTRELIPSVYYDTDLNLIATSIANTRNN